MTQWQVVRCADAWRCNAAHVNRTRDNVAMDYVAFNQKHLPGVPRLCEAEGWPSLPANPAKAVRSLTAPGVITVVAVEDGEVVGFTQVLTDGEIQAYLCAVVVVSVARGQGVGKKLIEDAFARSGAKRIDLLTLDDSEGFYRSFSHRSIPGYRIYPGDDPSDE